VRVARALGYTTATVATSDSGNDREIWPFALEIAVITPRPVVSVTSIQSRADDRFPPFIADLASGTVSYGKAERAVVPAAIRLPEGETIPRAILRVEIEGGTVVYGVHLNSSGPEVRERAVRMVLDHRGEDASSWPASASPSPPS